MYKKSIATFMAITVLVFGLASPAFAQQPGNGNGGLFGMFAHFFSRFFGNSQQSTTSGEQNQDGNMPSGVPNPTNTQQMEENRLQGLVTAGKITQAQEQEIIAEIDKINSEISAWSQSTGIDSGYVYGGLRGPGMSAGIGGGPMRLNGQEASPFPSGQPNVFFRRQGGPQGGGFGQNGNQ